MVMVPNLQTSTLKTSLSTQHQADVQTNLDREHGQDWESEDYKEQQGGGVHLISSILVWAVLMMTQLPS